MTFRFEGLDIWHMARAYATSVYGITNKFPARERFGLASQMNRAVNSISLNIAEGSGRRSAKAFDPFLDHAVASCFETVSGTSLALDRDYITVAEHQDPYQQGQRLAKSINAFRRTLR